jgi:hypothetical protein
MPALLGVFLLGAVCMYVFLDFVDLHSTGPALGNSCRIQVRADAVGDFGIVTTSTEKSNILVGVLAKVDSEWVVVIKNEEEYWVPRNVVVAIETHTDSR